MRYESREAHSPRDSLVTKGGGRVFEVRLLTLAGIQVDRSPPASGVIRINFDTWTRLHRVPPDQ